MTGRSEASPEASDDAIARIEQELRRGVIVLAALSKMSGPQYGYSLRQAMAEAGLPVEEGTLYPLLRRLEAQGFLESEWKIEDGPPRRYYTMSAKGKALYAELVASWRRLAGSIDAMIGEPEAKKRKA